MKKKVALVCAVCGSRNYMTDKNKEDATRLELKKFCRSCNVHTIHKQTK